MNPEAGICAEVLLFRPARVADRPLTYRVPPEWAGRVAPGVPVVVPLGPRTARGLVLALRPWSEARPLRDVLEVGDSPLVSEGLLDLARWMAEETVSALGDAVRCLVPPEFLARPRPRARFNVLVDRDRRPRRLGARQRAVVQPLGATLSGVPPANLPPGGGALRSLIPSGAVSLVDPGAARSGEAEGPRQDSPPPLLLWGEPEARRRWILEAVSEAVGRGQALVVVPETSAVDVFSGRLRGVVGDRVVAFHSGLSVRERREAWAKVQEGAADVVVGTRSALFAPVPNLALLVLDEEESGAHKAQESPRYHGRAVALERARREGARAVLGALAPSVETYAALLAGELECLRLPASSPGRQPAVVDMRGERDGGGGRGFLSRRLLRSLGRHLREGGRVVLFVPRRGYAPALRCRECGHPVRCPRCRVAVSYDRPAGEISCRVCGLKAPAPGVCPTCKGPGLEAVGAGSQRVQEVVRGLFPGVAVARVDRDTARERARTVELLASGRLRVVVGTQALLPAASVLQERGAAPTLVGVIDADAALFRPDFRAPERAFSEGKTLSALAAPGGEVVVQTRLPDHPVLAALRTGRDALFYEEELRVRKEFGYPPFTHLAQVVVVDPRPERAQALADRAAAIARSAGVEVLGPAPARSVRGHRVQYLLRAPTRAAVRDAARAVREGVEPGREGRLVIDIDPWEPL